MKINRLGSDKSTNYFLPFYGKRKANQNNIKEAVDINQVEEQNCIIEVIDCKSSLIGIGCKEITDKPIDDKIAESVKLPEPQAEKADYYANERFNIKLKSSRDIINFLQGGSFIDSITETSDVDDTVARKTPYNNTGIAQSNKPAYNYNAPELKLEPELKLKPRPEPEPKLEPELKPRPEPELKPRLEPELKPRPEPELKPRLEPELKPGLEPELKPRPEPAPEPEPVHKPRPEPKIVYNTLQDGINYSNKIDVIDILSKLKNISEKMR